MPNCDHALEDIFKPILHDRVLTSPQDLAHYGKDWCKNFRPSASLVVLPQSTAEVVEIVKAAVKNQIALVPSGGRTGLSGGATATNGEVIVALDRLKKIKSVNSIDRTIVAEAGVVTQRIQDAATEKGLFYPVEFTTKGSSQIGGNVSTNAGGIRVVRYGSTRDWVLGLKVVSGRGEVLELNGALYKNQTGYDLRSLFIGAEGTLGIITEVTLRLTLPPAETTRVMCALPSVKDVLPFFEKVRRSFPALSVFELFAHNALEKVLKHNPLSNPFQATHAYYLLIEIERTRRESPSEIEEFFSSAFESGALSDVVLAQNSKQAEEFMALREKIGETLSTHYFPHKNDISVPIPRIPEFIEKLTELCRTGYQGIETVIFGHVGDGNLHLNVLKPSTMSEGDFIALCKRADHDTFKMIQSLGGSISAEHGIGLLKREYLHFSRSENEIVLMREIKKQFDPAGIFNPGKIF